MSASESARTAAKSGRLTAFFSEERDAYVLGLLRVALSVLLFLNGMRLVFQLSTGYFADFFHLPIWPESWVPSRFGYELLLGVQACGAVLALVGLWPREALLLAASSGLFLLGCDRLQYHNNRYALLLFGFLLAFTPCDRSFLPFGRRAHALPLSERISPTFARKLFQIQVSLVYLSSSCGKLLDPDWRGGQVLHLRFVSVAPFLAEHGVQLPAWVAPSLASLLLANFAAKAALSTELFIALGLWWPSTRRAALWVGVCFHFWIELTARVELFSWLMVASYLAFVTPEVRQRRIEYDPGDRHAQRSARILGWLDWCARFQIVPSTPRIAGDAAFRACDRSGQATRGLAALTLIAEATPLLFPVWLPLSILAKLRAGASRTATL